MKRMYYHEVLVGSLSFHGQSALTYRSSMVLTPGQVVQVQLKQTKVLGIVTGRANRPNFPIKPIQTVYSLPPLPPETLKLLDWIRTYYPAPLGAIVQQFLPKSLLETPSIISSVITPVRSKSIKLPKLTDEQKNIITMIDKPGTFLIHGETGSGKTRVYLELAREAVAQGKSVIVLTPEISLITQLQEFFTEHLTTPAVIMHSQLTPAERRQNWLSIIQARNPQIIIGARSALMTPVANLGLVVVDEAHDNAYKQEQAPHYQAQRLAGQLAHFHNAKLVMGSATPSISEYYLATAKHIPVLRMQALARGHNNHELTTSIVDLKDRTQFNRSPYLSDKLIKAIDDSLRRREQSLLFLNRRGTARVVVCHQCGWQALCPNCDVPLTYHGDLHVIRCHICGHQQSAPSYCLVCASPDILFKSVGTKAIVDELERLLPQARIKRFDADNTKPERFNQQYQSVKAGDVDVLVGTQTLTKGLDLPRLSVVGVVVADTGLYLPDYTANERTYQILYQVLGRIGRGHRGGQAIIQSYEPHNPTITAAVERNWPSFYTRELQERQRYLFPPFCFLLKLSCRRTGPARAQAAATKLAKKLQNEHLPLQIVGPTPAFHEKLGHSFTWQLVIKAKQRSALLKVIASLPSGWSYDIDPVDLL